MRTGRRHQANGMGGRCVVPLVRRLSAGPPRPEPGFGGINGVELAARVAAPMRARVPGRAEGPWSVTCSRSRSAQQTEKNHREMLQIPSQAISKKVAKLARPHRASSLL